MKKYLMLFMLAGCGFQPMFTGDATDVYVSPIAGINGIELRNALNTQFGGAHNTGASYTLVVKLNDPVTLYKGLESTGDASWREVKLSATYTLSRGDDTIARGTESASESYAFVGYLVAANASYNNAVSNTIQVLATQIGSRVIAETRRADKQVAAQ